jgi:hypothetical protein
MAISGVNQSPSAKVVSTTATSIVLDRAFLTAVGGPVVPSDGDIVVFADYDKCQATQLASYVYDADGGASTSPHLGTSDVEPYVYGD